MAVKYVSQVSDTSEITEYNFEERMNEILVDFPDYVFEFFNNLSAQMRRPKTIIAYAIDIRVFFNFLINNNPTINNYKDVTCEVLNSFVTQDIDEYITHLRNYDSGKKTKKNEHIIYQNEEAAIRRKISSLRALLSYLFSTGHITNNALASYKFKRIKFDKKEPLCGDEVVDILTNMRNMTGLTESQQKYAERTYYRDLAIMTLFLQTGIRVSELVNLDISDINEKDLTLKVVRKGGKNDYVLLSDETYEAIIDYIELERWNDPAEEAIFLSSRRGENSRLSVKSCERIVSKYAKNFTKKHVTPHTLRRTFGTTLYNESGDLYLVQQALGHEDISTTSRYYTTLGEARANQIRNLKYTKSEK